MDMPEREKVIEHIEDCVKIADMQVNKRWVFVRAEILRDALAMLKNPEPQHETARVITKGGSGIIWWCACEKCDTSVNTVDEYCRGCGRKLIWDE